MNFACEGKVVEANLRTAMTNKSRKTIRWEGEISRESSRLTQIIESHSNINELVVQTAWPACTPDDGEFVKAPHCTELRVGHWLVWLRTFNLSFALLLLRSFEAHRRLAQRWRMKSLTSNWCAFLNVLDETQLLAMNDSPNGKGIFSQRARSWK